MPFPLEWRDVFEIRPRPIVGAVSLGPGTDLDGRRDAQEVKKMMATYAQYPPRKVQSYGYTGPITLSDYEHSSG